MAREVFQRLATPDDLNVRCRQAFLGVVLQHSLQLPHVGHDFTTHPAPADGLGFLGALAANVDDVVLDSLGAEFAFALGLVGANRVRRFEVVPRIEE